MFILSRNDHRFLWFLCSLRIAHFLLTTITNLVLCRRWKMQKSRRASFFLSTLFLLSIPSFYGGKSFQNCGLSNSLKSALYLAMREAPTTVTKVPRPKNIFEVDLCQCSDWKCLTHLKWKKVDKKSIRQISVGTIQDEKPFEENIFDPSHYTHSGCPTVPIAFAGGYH